MSNQIVLTSTETWLGSTLATADEAGGKVQPTLTEPLLKWLSDLVLLRNVPVHYLIPSEDLLPTESLRFFHVDPVWIDRLLDGALSAGNLGSRDLTFAEQHIKDIRGRLKPYPQAGVLLRSEMVRRWPQMTVRAYAIDSSPKTQAGLGSPTNRAKTLRQERLAPGILIALFDQVPVRVDFEEPNEGTRFGLETNETKKPAATAFTLQLRDSKGGLGAERDVKMRSGNPSSSSTNIPRILDVTALAIDRKPPPPPAPPGTPPESVPPPPTKASPAELAFQLQQAPYVQVCRMSDPLVEPDLAAQEPDKKTSRMFFEEADILAVSKSIQLGPSKGA